MSDLISRADAIDAVFCANPIDKEYHYYKHIALDALNALPSAEIPTESTNTPTNTPTDLISRADAIDAVCDKCPSDKYCDRSCRHICVIPEALSALPSAKGSDAEMNEVKPQYMQVSPSNGADLISMSEPKTGEWIFEETDEYKRTYCSVCGVSAPFICVSDDHYGRRCHGETKKTKFCPSCGARMKGGDSG